ncbi:DUF943 family protein [Erwinia sp. DT-104]|jgi:hypothetical protein|uniref:DUF943 family protein n=1 Tax=Erwinia plantamica TaxID=3237104 RepID=A0ABW7CQ19_9GAMM|nr:MULTISPECIES: DUF943 family protein [unclassified Erwinia]MDN4629474.1 DUF943 family protein [Erwinia sp. PsM31]MDN8543761.1 DUF943 family protein [Erwinia sp. BC051422]
MKSKIKKAFCASLLISCTLLVYLLLLSLRPVKIIAVHQRHNYSDVLVKNFPLTEQGKINWWLKNKEILKNRYNIPRPARDGFFTVIFWDFGDGYKETDGYDRLCFNDMKPPVNCIDKDSLIMVNNSRNTGLYFIVDSGTYRINDSGKMVKNKSD